MSLVSFPSWGETWDNMVTREGLLFSKSSNLPFTGYVDGGCRGMVKNGMKDGSWTCDNIHGRLHRKSNYRNGQKHGLWVEYHSNGKLRLKGHYKNGKQDGYWFRYFGSGDLNYIDSFKNGKEHGYRLSFYRDGRLFGNSNGLYKNGVKVSD